MFFGVYVCVSQKEREIQSVVASMHPRHLSWGFGYICCQMLIRQTPANQIFAMQGHNNGCHELAVAKIGSDSADQGDDQGR
jgi:hypothetical protein